MHTRRAPLTDVATQGPVPVAAAERLHALDILRGLALCGMILVHFHQKMRLPAEGVEDLIGWGVWIFVEQKAWGTFAFLFGVGFAVFLRRLEARGVPVTAIYLRRLAGLAAFGLIAHVGFGFVILTEYALWGLALLLIHRWSTRALLVTAAVAACIGPAIAEFNALHAWLTNQPPVTPSGASVFRAAYDAAQQGDYLVLLAARWRVYLASLPHDWRTLIPSSNLPLFIIGLLAVRHGVFENPIRQRRLIVGWMAFGALSWAVSWVVLRNLPEMPTPRIRWPLEAGLGLVSDQWLCFTYIGAVVLLLAYRRQWVHRLRVFGLAGRMALTNYMLQVAVLDILASGYGFHLKLRPFVYLPAAAALFGAEAALSRAWLPYFRFGPLEWLWRSMTYWRWQPLRRDRSAGTNEGATSERFEGEERTREKDLVRTGSSL